MYKSSAPGAGTLTVNTSNNQVVGWTDVPEYWSTNTADWGAVPTNGGSQNTRWSFARMIEGADGYRLPTEAEGEYACRAGTTTAYNIYTGYSYETYEEYYGSDTINNTLQNAQAYMGPQTGTKEVGSTGVGYIMSNRFNLWDMHGNVAEWCWDWYGGDYGSGDQTDPKGGPVAIGGQYYKVLRGGSVASDPTGCRSATRERIFPYLDRGAAGPFPGKNAINYEYVHNTLTGLRVVRYIKQ
jgi:formylglycine-generating enzyme required for sulfatase activity